MEGLIKPLRSPRVVSLDEVHGQGKDRRRKMWRPLFVPRIIPKIFEDFGKSAPETSDPDVFIEKVKCGLLKEIEEYPRMTLNPLNILLLGKTSSGKSSFINSCSTALTESRVWQTKEGVYTKRGMFMPNDPSTPFFNIPQNTTATTGCIEKSLFGVSPEKRVWQTKEGVYTKRGMFMPNDPSTPFFNIPQNTTELGRHVDKNSLDEPDRVSSKMYIFANHHFPTSRLISMWVCMDFGRNPMETEREEDGQNPEIRNAVHKIVISADNATDDIKDKAPPNELEILTTEHYRQSEQLRRENDKQIMEIEEALRRILHHLDVQTKVEKRKRCHASA